jgi:hypothetical protein
LGLTQEGLAELANAQVENDTGKPGAMDADYVSKLERGVHTWPGKHYRRALCTLLDERTDADLGFYSARSKAVTVVGEQFEGARGSDDVKRQAFLRAVAATVAGMAVGNPVAEAVGRAVNGDVPSRVGSAEIEQVNHAITLLGNGRIYTAAACARMRLQGKRNGLPNFLLRTAPIESKMSCTARSGF